MRIGIQTWGSHGDIRPMLALAEGLQAAGHAVHLVITCVDSGAYQDLRSASGVRISVVASPVIGPEQARDIGRTAYGIRNPMTQMATILSLCYAPAQDAMFEAAEALCAESDLVIGHYFMMPLQTAAEKAGLPYVSVLLSHACVPSAFNHSLGLAFLGRTGKRLLWRLTRSLLQRTLETYANRFRRRLGLPLVRDVVNQVWLSRHLTLVAVSGQICEAQPDWPATVQTCGFLDMPNLALEGALPGALDAFLASGDAPVYMTLGSWMPADTAGQTETLALLTEAARQAGRRAIIQGSSWQACGFASNEQVLYVSGAPHHAVFPRCRAVVHHGGAGTTQSAGLAGLPSVVIAHISEQEHWGRELRRLGIGGKPLYRRGVRAADIARQIRRVCEDPAAAARARAIAAGMRQENGVAQAVALIGQRFGAGRPHAAPPASSRIPAGTASR